MGDSQATGMETPTGDDELGKQKQSALEITRLRQAFEAIFNGAHFEKPESVSPMMPASKTKFYQNLETEIKKHATDEREKIKKDLAPANQFLQSAALERDNKGARLTAIMHVDKTVCRIVLDESGSMTARFDRGVEKLNRKQMYLVWAKATFALWQKLYHVPKNFPTLEMVEVNEDDVALVKETFGVYFAHLTITDKNNKVTECHREIKGDDKPVVSLTTNNRQGWIQNNSNKPVASFEVDGGHGSAPGFNKSE